VPFDVDMSSRFTIDQGRLLFDRIDLTTEGTKTRLLGDASLSHWPEQMYRMHSTVDFPWMRKIFFAKESFALSGAGTFDGTFHLFRDRLPDGRNRTGREVRGTFTSPTAGLNSLRFGDLKGAVKWVPESVEVTDTSMAFYGGSMNLDYTMAPFGQPGVEATYTISADYEDVDLVTFGDYLETQGVRLAGRASGQTTLEWPRGRFAERVGEGRLRVVAPSGVTVMTDALPLQRYPAEADAERAPAQPCRQHAEAFRLHRSQSTQPMPAGGGDRAYLGGRRRDFTGDRRQDRDRADRQTRARPWRGNPRPADAGVEG
jgi:hypothetical protein